MAWWLTVYCTRPVCSIEPETLLGGIRDRDPAAPAGVDYYTLAEDFDLDEAAVDEALAHLSLRRASDRPLDLELRYRSDPSLRPIALHGWTTPSRVAEELAECTEVRSPPDDVVAMMAEVCEIVGIELGASQLGDMGIVLAYELGRYLCQRGDGALVDDEGQWLGVHDGAWVEL